MADFSRLPGPNADLWDWQLVAACRGVDSSLFFHPEGERGAARSAREAAAKEVCMRCPVRAECATHALTVREPYGVWGGLTEDEREAMMGRSRNRSSHSAAHGSSHGSSHHSSDRRGPDVAAEVRSRIERDLAREARGGLDDDLSDDLDADPSVDLDDDADFGFDPDGEPDLDLDTEHDPSMT